ncbi:Macro domain-containing protein [Spironucleus salmonicida]|uniref:Macro domain-containing protein n=1 Tax=Spironucleus salmonicida TaxID=348837 RepID=V6LUR0_9EUKA|nr:Macro domain-containing protein [Spironucleus salmonicida]|eukprot:EST47993.1 Macro domain-containing protein [Spironucleus salmonicida]
MNQPIPFSSKLKISLSKDSITQQHTQAIVNAANKQLYPGGGVCGAIYKAAGPDLQIATEQIGFCESGSAVATPAFNLAQEFIIHTVGPDCRTRDNENRSQILTSCYNNVIQMCKKLKIRSVSFPCLSCGIYQFPLTEAAEIAFQTVLRSEFEGEVVFCVFGREEYEEYSQLKKYYKC